MLSFEVGGHKYQAGKILPFDQLAIAKRMMPVMKNILTPEVLASIVSLIPKKEEQKSESDDKENHGTAPKLSLESLHSILPALCDAIYSLSDDDAERIVRTALKVVQRQNDGGVWSSVMTPQGALLFDDIDLPIMLQIAWKVIEGNIGSFFNTAR